MRRRQIALAAALLVALTGGWALADPPASPISGVVRHLKAPVSGVLVILYNVGEHSFARIRTSPDGTFVVTAAPVGVYDLIAYKRGFEPGLRRIWHQAGLDQISAVQIELARKGPSTGAPGPQPATIWELRGRLPADVLREIGLEEDETEEPAAADAAAMASTGAVSLDRFAGEVRAMTDVASQSTASALSRGEVGLRGGLPNGWQYDIAGDYATLGKHDPGETTTGNATGLALDVAPSASQRVSLSTRRNQISFGESSPASLQSHTVTWSRGAEQGHVESVAARYIEEANLYRATAPGTTLFPIASRTWEVNGRYGRPATDSPGVVVGMTYRHREATVGPSGVGSKGAFLQSAPDADLSAASSLRLGESVELEGGVVARYVGAGFGIAPQLTARYDFGPATLYVRGLYRVADSSPVGTVLPRVASIEESQEPAAREAYAAGVSRTVGRDTSFQVEVSQQKMGELVRAFFAGDFLTDFDSVYLLEGNTVRQYQAVGQHRISETLAGSVSVRYGQIDGSVDPESRTSYGIASNTGRFWSARAAVQILPTRTGVAVVVRGIRQQLETAATVLANESDKLAISVAQDLSVIGVTPFGADWKLLVALEATSGTTPSAEREEEQANRLMGGLAVSF